jgi:hypothetical protein
MHALYCSGLIQIVLGMFLVLGHDIAIESLIQTNEVSVWIYPSLDASKS